MKALIAVLAASAFLALGALAETYAPPPVTSVNTQIGAVTVPTLCRQQSASLSIPTANPGLVSWTFPNTICAFASPPSCWMDITTAATGYAFDYPLNTARSIASVTYSFTAHASVLTISLGSLSLTTGAPTNSTVVMTCTAPPG